MSKVTVIKPLLDFQFETENSRGDKFQYTLREAFSNIQTGDSESISPSARRYFTSFLKAVNNELGLVGKEACLILREQMEIDPEYKGEGAELFDFVLKVLAERSEIVRELQFFLESGDIAGLQKELQDRGYNFGAAELQEGQELRQLGSGKN